MDLNDPEFQKFVQAKAAETLAQLGYEPIRELPWRPVTPPAAPFEDSQVDADLEAISVTAIGIVSRLRRLDPEADPFSLILEGDPGALFYNATLVDAQRLLRVGAHRIATASVRYQEVAEETYEEALRLTEDDIEYVQREFERRRRLGQELMAYCSDPVHAAVKPKDIHGAVIGPVSAGGLAQRYLVDMLELKHRMQTEADLSFFDRTAAELNAIVGQVGSDGTAYIRLLASAMEEARRRSAGARRFGIALLSVCFMVAGVFLDRFLTNEEVLGGFLWISIVAGSVIWLVDKAASDWLEKQVRRKQIEIIQDAVTRISGWLAFLRQQQTHLNAFRISVDKVPVQLALDWA